jgi:hypothetical protein
MVPIMGKRNVTDMLHGDHCPALILPQFHATHVTFPFSALYWSVAMTLQSELYTLVFISVSHQLYFVVS